jgi:hypothetical protein
MDKWIMEVKVYNTETLKWEWAAVRPSGGKQYEYNTKEEATKMINLCYGSLSNDQARIRKIQ